MSARVQTSSTLRPKVESIVAATDGVLRFRPAWVARDWLPPGRRLGLSDEDYDVGERGFICERWLGSTTRADNRVGPPDEGLSYIETDGGDNLTLADAVRAIPELILGSSYASNHEGLGRLAKIYDYGERIPYHIHPPREHSAKVGRNPKDEAYYFPPDVPLGNHPESFFGVHPWIAETRAYDVLLPFLEAWDSDRILQHARGYMDVPGEGFLILSGVLHAPGTALTIELQEDSDCLAILQALNAGKIISKELLFKDVSAEDRATYGERAVLNWVDWERNGDPYFFENHHLSPQLIRSSEGVTEEWIYYGTPKFSGKRLTLAPGARHTAQERGVYTALVWKGVGSVAGATVAGASPGQDELLLVHDRASSPHEYVNTGSADLVVITFFGPDINPDVPPIPRWPSSNRA